MKPQECLLRLAIMSFSILCFSLPVKVTLLIHLHATYVYILFYDSHIHKRVLNVHYFSVAALTTLFSYIIEGRVCYLTLCDRSYPKKLAFQYLEDLKNEFEKVNGNQIETAARPYAFIKFGMLNLCPFHFYFLTHESFFLSFLVVIKTLSYRRQRNCTRIHTHNVILRS